MKQTMLLSSLSNGETELKKYFTEHGKEVAAIIIEGIQGVGGINVATESFSATHPQFV
jgi:acetylornithine aminotransferase